MSNPTKLTCPLCKSTMTASKSLRAGKRINCPRCHVAFDVPKTSPTENVETTNDSVAPTLGVLENRPKLKREKSNGSVLTAKPFSPPAVEEKTDEPARTSETVSVNAPVDVDYRKRIFLGTVAGIVLIAVGLFAISQFQSSAQDARQPPVEVAEKPSGEKTEAPNENAPKPQPKAVLPKPPAKFPGENKGELKQFPPNPGPQAQVELLPPPVLVEKSSPKKIEIAKAEPKMVKPKQKPKPVVRSTLPLAKQEMVDSAIKRGVDYLKKRQRINGSWVMGNVRHHIGYAALPGLTLLECGASPECTAVQDAAKYVRLNCGNLTKTYELALAILFLDRLGDLRDRPLIQSMALRLVAGQHENGGWGYDCPLVPPKNMIQLFVNLLRNRAAPPPFRDPLENVIQFQRAIEEKQADLRNPLAKATLKEPLNPLKAIEAKGERDSRRAVANPELILARAIENDGRTKLLELPYPNVPRQFILSPAYSQKLAGYYFNPPSESSKAKPKTPESKPKPAAQKKRQPDPLDNPKLNQLMDKVLRMRPGPARRKLLQQVQKALLNGQPFNMRRDDNSNSQFAMLGLWAARRHGVPTGKTLSDAAKRYRLTQNPDGGWGYKVRDLSYPAMSGVGLLGLAMGYGIAEKDENANKQRVVDRAIQKGLQKFAWYIDNKLAQRGHRNAFNLYFLWTVERVAVLYSLQRIDGKDWYSWGVDVLLPRQGGDGAWWMGEYPGSESTIDTCFALLFLKRSNLVRDLSDNLRFHLAISDSDSDSGSAQE